MTVTVELRVKSPGELQEIIEFIEYKTVNARVMEVDFSASGKHTARKDRIALGLSQLTR